MSTPAFRSYYKDIDSLDIQPLEAHARNIEVMQDRVRSVSARHVLKIGKELIEARERLGKKGTGTFGRWCRDRLKMSRRSCYNYIYAYEVFGDCAIVAQMFDVTAMYYLSQPGVHSRAVTEALIHAEGGRRITLSWAKQILELLDVKKEGESKYEQKKRRKKEEKEQDKREEGEGESEEDDGGKEHDPDSSRLARLKRFYNETPADDRAKFKEWLEERQEKYRHKRHANHKRLVECGDKGVETMKRKGEFKPKYGKDGRRLDRKGKPR